MKLKKKRNVLTIWNVKRFFGIKYSQKNKELLNWREQLKSQKKIHVKFIKLSTPNFHLFGQVPWTQTKQSDTKTKKSICKKGY